MAMQSGPLKKMKTRDSELEKIQERRMIQRMQRKLRKQNKKNGMENMPLESNISRTFSERTTRVVIILILTTLFALPFMEITTYVNFQSQFTIQFQTLQDLYEFKSDGQLSITDYEEAVQNYIDTNSNHELPLVKLMLYETDW